MPARAACFLLLVLPLSACAGPAAQSDQTARPIDPAVKASIYEYLDTQDAERADQLLAEILGRQDATPATVAAILGEELVGDRKSTRLNSSHVRISYAVFCLKKKMSTSTRRGPMEV